eukprot:m.227847 g.227847  ORF g.227847 m.227847 type:complete len:1950 (+) comp17330_c0_seq1:197-6046(+)
MDSWLEDISQTVQRRFARFILHKTLGGFLKYKLDLDQVHLGSGGAFKLTNLELDCVHLDSYLTNTPFQLSHGWVDVIEGQIPYTRLLHAHTSVKIQGLELWLQPRPEQEGAAAATAPSVDELIADLQDVVDQTSSDLAFELQQDIGEGELDHVAVAIKRILSKLHGELTDLKIRIFTTPNIHVPGDSILFKVAQADLEDVTRDTVAEDQRSEEEGFDPALSVEIRKQLVLRGWQLSVEHGVVSQEADELTIDESVKLLGSLTPNKPDTITLIYTQTPSPNVSVACFFHTCGLVVAPTTVERLKRAAEPFAMTTEPLPEEQPASPTSPSVSDSEEAETTVPVTQSASSEDQALQWRVTLSVMDLLITMPFQHGVEESSRFFARCTALDNPVWNQILPDVWPESPALMLCGHNCQLKMHSQQEPFGVQASLASLLAMDIASQQQAQCVLQSPRSDAVASSEGLALEFLIQDQATHINITLPATYMMADLSLLDRLHPFFEIAQASSAKGNVSTLPPGADQTEDSDVAPSIITFSGPALRLLVLVPMNNVQTDAKPDWFTWPQYRSKAMLVELTDFRLQQLSALEGDWHSEMMFPGSANANATSGLLLNTSDLKLGFTNKDKLDPIELVFLSSVDEQDVSVGLFSLPPAAMADSTAGFPLAVKYNIRGNHSVTTPTPLGPWMQTVQACANLSVSVHAPLLHGHLPKADVDQLYQLLIEIVAWRGYKPTVTPIEPSGSEDSPPSSVGGVREVHFVDSLSASIATDTTATTAATTARDSALGQPPEMYRHALAAHVTFDQLKLGIEEATVSTQVPTTFKVHLDRGEIGFVTGLDNADRSVIAINGHSPLIEQTALLGQGFQAALEPVLEPEHLQNLGVKSYFALHLCSQPAESVSLAKSIVGTLLEGVRLHYFADPGGIWLFRILSWLSFPDPEDWPKPDPATRPTVVTNLNAQFNVSEIAHKPLQLPSALLIPVEQLTITSNIVSKVDATNVTILLENMDVLAVDDVRKLQEGQDWQARGWRKIATTSFTRVETALNSAASEIAQSFKISNELIQVSLCEDSLVTVVDLMSYIVGSKDDVALEELRQLLAEADRPTGEDGVPATLPLTKSNLQALAAQLQEQAEELAPSSSDEQSELFYSAVSMAQHSPLPPESPATPSPTTPLPEMATSRRSRGAPTPEVEYLDDVNGIAMRSWASSPHEAQPVLHRVASTDSLTLAERERMEALSPTASTTQNTASEGAATMQFGQPMTLNAALSETAVAAALGDALLSPVSTRAPQTLPTSLVGEEDYFNKDVSHQTVAVTVPSSPERTVSSELASIIHDSWSGDSSSPTRAYELIPAPAIEAETSTPPTHTTTVLPTKVTEKVRLLDGDIDVVPNFFKLPSDQMEKELETYEFLPLPKRKLTLERVNVKLQLLPGHHWLDMDANELPEEVVPALPLPSTINTALSLSAHQDDAPQAEGTDAAVDHEGLDIDLRQLSVVADSYPNDAEYGSRLLVIAQQINVWDRLSLSVVNQLLTDYQTEQLPRETGSNMLRMEMISVKTPGLDGDDALETILNVELLPMRVNVDQDMLNFLVRFIAYAPRGSEAARLADQIGENWQTVTLDNDEPHVHDQDPVTVTATAAEVAQHQRLAEARPGESWLEALTTEPVSMLNDDGNPIRSSMSSVSEMASSTPTVTENESESLPTPYFKLVRVSPVVMVVNYAPKRMSVSELLHGDFEQLAGIIALTDAKLYLSPLSIKGVNGFPALVKSMLDAWIARISSSQMHQLVIAGLPGGSNVASVVAASADIVHRPITQYPYVLQGFREGVSDGVRITAVEMCNVATAMAFGVQTALELAQMLTLSTEELEQQSSQPPRSRMARQPKDASDGLKQAYDALRAGFKRSYVQTAVAPFESSPSATQGVLRMIGALPGASLQPVIAFCEAAALSLQGARNSMAPTQGKTLEQQYKPL